MKRYLGIPYISNNAITHYISETTPISDHLRLRVGNFFLGLRMPNVLSGVKFTPPENSVTTGYRAIERIQTYFWLSPVLDSLPVLPEPRRAILYDVMDLHHSHICNRNDFHLHPHDDVNGQNRTCICRFCHHVADQYHYRECPKLRQLSPCARLRTVFATRE